jgi:hypothetical protein
MSIPFNATTCRSRTTLVADHTISNQPRHYTPTAMSLNANAKEFVFGQVKTMKKPEAQTEAVPDSWEDAAPSTTDSDAKAVAAPAPQPQSEEGEEAPVLALNHPEQLETDAANQDLSLEEFAAKFGISEAEAAELRALEAGEEAKQEDEGAEELSVEQEIAAVEQTSSVKAAKPAAVVVKAQVCV